MKKFTFISLLVMVLGCSKLVDINYPETDNKLVINCLFTVNKPITAQISISTTYNSSDKKYINNATCNLYIDDEFAETLTFSKNGMYQGKIIPTTNKTYKIVVNAEGYDEISAESYIPTLAANIEFDTINSVVFDPNDGLGVYYTKGLLKIADNANTNDYYLTKLTAEYINSENQANPIFKYRSNDPVLEDEGLLNYGTDCLLFSDKIFNGENYSMLFEYNVAFVTSDTGLLYVSTKQVSKEYYQYLKSLIIQTNNQATIEDPFVVGEPIEIYTNVKKGYGIFAGYNIHIDTIVFENYHF